MFDIRDRGFDPVSAIVALVFVMLVVMQRRPRLRSVLPIAVASGLTVAGLIFLVAFRLQAGAHPALARVTLHQIDGAPVALTAFMGKPTVINLWATWCPPCRAELPMLVAAGAAMPSVRFVFVDQGESATTIESFLARAALAPRHVLLDPNSVLSRDYRALGYPTTLFVDATGHLQDTQMGALSRATLAQHLARIIPSGNRRTP